MDKLNLLENGWRGQFVVVTTDKDKRGVFAGFLEDITGDGDVVLGKAQNSIYWSAETRGVFGLAAHGPQDGSKIGPPVEKMALSGVTSITWASETARKAWRKEIWS